MLLLLFGGMLEGMFVVPKSDAARLYGESEGQSTSPEQLAELADLYSYDVKSLTASNPNTLVEDLVRTIISAGKVNVL